jgi:threonyl-tRNA synthetase
MNCPHHHKIYDTRPRSYRELPLRLAEYGEVYRYEQSGELSGLLRVRSLTINDAHIYLREEQIEEELRTLLSMYKDYYRVFGISKEHYSFRLSLRDEEHSKNKYKGSDELWVHAESILKKILEEEKIPFHMGLGDAAFYGPKIDIQFKNLMGREETASTIQLDFLGAQNFSLSYIDEQGVEKKPVIIHRAPLATHERFISFLTEYYAGAFPTWMAPTQVVLIPLGQKCEDLYKSLLQKKIRVVMDLSDHSLNKKIRAHTVKKVPYILVIGEREVRDQLVSVRSYGHSEQEVMPTDAFIQRIQEEIRERTLNRTPLGIL